MINSFYYNFWHFITFKLSIPLSSLFLPICLSYLTSRVMIHFQIVQLLLINFCFQSFSYLVQPSFYHPLEKHLNKVYIIIIICIKHPLQFYFYCLILLFLFCIVIIKSIYILYLFLCSPFSIFIRST